MLVYLDVECGPQRLTEDMHAAEREHEAAKCKLQQVKPMIYAALSCTGC